MTAAFANAIPYLLFAVAEQTVSSATAGALNSTTPLWTALLARMTRLERTFTATRVSGLIVGFIGSLVLLGSPVAAVDQPAQPSRFAVGALACLAAAACYGVGYTYQDRHLSRLEGH